MKENYRLDGEVASLAIRNRFTECLNNVAYNLGVSLKPFCFYANTTQVEHSVIDLCNVGLDAGSETTIFNDIVAVRREQLALEGVFLPTEIDLETKRLLFLDYMLSVSVCYIEIPKFITKNSRRQLAYEKFFATNNLRLISYWIDESIERVTLKYGGVVKTSFLDFTNKEVRLVKLGIGSKGTKVTVPRKAISHLNMSCTPLFMINRFTDGFTTKLNTRILNFKFEKDNGTVRELNSTLNKDIMLKYYGDEGYVNGVFSKIEMPEEEVGGLTLSPKQSRGYIKIPEIGASKYDYSGTRSLNVARVLSISEVTEVDRTYIDVDLNSILANFDKELNYMRANMTDQVLPMLEALMGKPANPNWTISQAYEYASYWVSEQTLVLTTTYRKNLHKFMILNPQWFPNYTGRPCVGYVPSGVMNFGAE